MRTLLALLAFLLLTSLVVAQEAPTITQTGEGSVSAAPDEAYIIGGVVTNDASASAALKQNAEIMTPIIAALKAKGITDANIGTIAFTITDHYKRVASPGGGWDQVKDGYLVTNKLKVTVCDVTKFGEIIDVMVTKGANDIDALVLGNSKRDELMDKARAAAVDVASHRARLIAKQHGYSLGHVVTTHENPPPRGGGEGYYLADVRSGVPGGSPTPIAAGSQEFKVSVTTTWKMVPLKGLSAVAPQDSIKSSQVRVPAGETPRGVESGTPRQPE